MNKKVDDFIYKLFTSTEKEDLNYLFTGDFSDHVTDTILALAESSLSTMSVASKIKKRVYLILVEGIQNVSKHQESILENDHGFFIIQHRENDYHISTANLIDKNNIDYLVEHIEKINKLSTLELKTLYKEILKHGEMSNKGGAGLGLVDMARKSGSKLRYKFVPYNEEFSFFYMQTTLKNRQEGVEVEGISLDNIVDIHELVADQKISLLFNSLISQESLLYLLSIIETQIADATIFKKRVYNTMVEMLQNIIHHGVNPDGDETFIPGIFFVGENEEQYILYTGNYIVPENAKKLNENIDYVNSLDFEELENYFNRRLLDFEIDSSKEAGLGIIDIRLKSQSKINCKIKNINKDLTFFSVEVLINRN